MSYLIENHTIAFRSTSPHEVELICALESHHENNSFILPYDEQRHQQVISSEEDAHLIIEDKVTKSILGFIILAGLQNEDLSLELRRIVILSKGQGQGRQSLQLLKQYCFEVLKFRRLWLDVFDDNARAINLYASEGFTEEARLRKVVKQGDGYRTLLLFSISAD